MTQSSCELVSRAVEIKGLDHLPNCFESLGISDIASIRWNYFGTGYHSRAETLDEWGCRWERTQELNMGQGRGHPLADLHNLDHYLFSTLMIHTILKDFDGVN